jgi:hypothetical protein
VTDSVYLPEIPPICPPTQHTTRQYEDGTHSEVCTTCGLALVDYDPEELEEIWHRDQVLYSDEPPTETERELDSP